MEQGYTDWEQRILISRVLKLHSEIANSQNNSIQHHIRAVQFSCFHNRYFNIMLSQEDGGIVMLIEDSKLRKLAKLLCNQEEPLYKRISTEPERTEYIQDCTDSDDKVISLLDKCNDFNEPYKHGSNINEPELLTGNQCLLEHAKDTIMQCVRKWCLSIGWAGLADDLEYEIQVAYEKFCNLRKYYYNDCSEISDQPGPDLSKVHIANDIQDYVRYAINIGLQCVRNCSSRKIFLTRIEEHIKILDEELEDLNVGNQIKLRVMAENVSSYKKCMLEFARSCGSGSVSISSIPYSTILQNQPVQLSNKLERKMNELGFAGHFDDLTEKQQVQVYHGILKETGRANMLGSELENQPSDMTGSLFAESDCLLVEYIFGRRGKFIPDLNNPAFRGAPMPDGRALACQIEYSEN